MDNGSVEESRKSMLVRTLEGDGLWSKRKENGQQGLENTVYCVKTSNCRTILPNLIIKWHYWLRACS